MKKKNKTKEEVLEEMRMFYDIEFCKNGMSNINTEDFLKGIVINTRGIGDENVK